jgi:hypothetical protein
MIKDLTTRINRRDADQCVTETDLPGLGVVADLTGDFLKRSASSGALG